MDIKKQIEYNIKVHNKVSKNYDKTHMEIFSKTEQKRIISELKFSASKIKFNSKKALDFGCGSGNLTNHLLKLNFKVSCADVSDKFLELIPKKFSRYKNKIKTIKLNGENLSNIKDNSFDIVATYSVLHHIPNYLKAINEMYRVLKPGGVIYIDHEVSPTYWNPSNDLIKFRKKVRIPYIFYNLNTYLTYATFKTFIIQKFNSKYRPEGDIHVFKEDHIEWNKIKKLLEEKNCEILKIDDYLLYKEGYPKNIYNKYKNKCHDYRVLIGRKKK